MVIQAKQSFQDNGYVKEGRIVIVDESLFSLYMVTMHKILHNELFCSYKLPIFLSLKGKAVDL